MFDIDEKGLYQVCDRTEVLRSFRKIVANIWVTCQNCLGDDCLICDAYYYAFGQLEMSSFGGATDDTLSRLYRQTNQHFMGKAYFYCLCDLYQWCQTYVDFIHQVRSYCSICKVYNHCFIDDLHQIRKDMCKLIDFHKILPENLLEIEKVGGKNIIFWEDEIEFKCKD